MAALLRHLSQDLVDGKLAGAKAVFFLLLSSFPSFFKGKNFPPFFAHAKRKTQNRLCCVKIPFLLHIQLLVMGALFLNCLLALHSDNAALLVL